MSIIFHLYIITLNDNDRTEIFRKHISDDSDNQKEGLHPWDFLENWLDTSGFRIPKDGITFKYVSSESNLKTVCHKVYDLVKMDLGQMCSDHGYRKMTSLWLTHSQGSTTSKLSWKLFYDYDLGLYDLLSYHNGEYYNHSGCTGQCTLLIDKDAAVTLNEFLEQQYDRKYICGRSKNTDVKQYCSDRLNMDAKQFEQKYTLEDRKFFDSKQTLMKELLHKIQNLSMDKMIDLIYEL